MRSTLIGLVLVALGVLALWFRGIPYKAHETVVDVGPFHATAEQERTIAIPPYIGAVVVAAGALVLVMRRR